MTAWGDDPELLATFRAEVEERLASLQAGLMALEGHPSPRQVVGGLVGTGATLILFAAGFIPPGTRPSLVIAASITVLLSGLSVVSTVQDSTTRPSTAPAGGRRPAVQAPRNPWVLVLSREVRVRLADKTFLFSTFFRRSAGSGSDGSSLRLRILLGALTWPLEGPCPSALACLLGPAASAPSLENRPTVLPALVFCAFCGCSSGGWPSSAA